MPRGEYLLEVRTAELSPTLQRQALRGLSTRLFEELMDRALAPKEMVTGRTPRRLMVCLRGLPPREATRDRPTLGPPVEEAYDAEGRPTAALEAFAAEVAAPLESLVLFKTEQGERLGLERRLTGRPTPVVLGELVPRLLGDLRRLREVRWGSDLGPWIAPVEGVLSVWEGEELPFEHHGVKASRRTVGHPVLSPSSVAVAGLADYHRRLRRWGIEVDFERRQQRLEKAMRLAAKGVGDIEIAGVSLDRLAAMCEIPGAVAGTFDPDFLALPEELIVAALTEREDALPLRSKGELLPSFLGIMDRLDDPEGRVCLGLERAVSGRLTDARSLHEEDRRIPLAERARGLDGRPFARGLGSYGDKARRLEELCRLLCEELGLTELLDRAREAAVLLKVDLGMLTVREHPTLRGVAGGLQARREGYVEAVWQAVYDQYLPVGPVAPIPRSAFARAVAVADRIDTLVGFFRAGRAPPDRRDPLGLRPLAHGLLRILTEGSMEVDLDLLVARAALLWREGGQRSAEETVPALRTFLHERLSLLLAERGYRGDEIEAAIAVRANDPAEVEARVRALHEVRREEGFPPLVRAAKRIHSIVGGATELELTEALLSHEAEIALHGTLGTVRKRVEKAVEGGRYEEALRRMQPLAPPLERFFREVLVMDEDRELRDNRIALLEAVRRVFGSTARLHDLRDEDRS